MARRTRFVKVKSVHAVPVVHDMRGSSATRASGLSTAAPRSRSAWVPSSIEFCARRGLIPVHLTPLAGVVEATRVYTELAARHGLTVPFGARQNFCRFPHVAPTHADFEKRIRAYDVDRSSTCSCARSCRSWKRRRERLTRPHAEEPSRSEGVS